MISISATEKPYITLSSLNKKTEWIAYPITITSADKDYRLSFLKAKKVVDDLQRLAASLVNESCKQIEELGFGEFEDMKESLDFSKVKDSHYSTIQTYVVIKFEAKVDFWEKTQLIANHLDKLSEYISGFKSEKTIEVLLNSQSGNSLSFNQSKR